MCSLPLLSRFRLLCSSNLQYDISSVVKFLSVDTTEAIGISGPLNPDRHMPLRPDPCACISSSVALFPVFSSPCDTLRYRAGICVRILFSCNSSRCSPVKLMCRCDLFIKFFSLFAVFLRFCSALNSRLRHIISKVSLGRSFKPALRPSSGSGIVFSLYSCFFIYPILRLKCSCPRAWALKSSWWFIRLINSHLSSSGAGSVGVIPPDCLVLIVSSLKYRFRRATHP